MMDIAKSSLIDSDSFSTTTPIMIADIGTMRVTSDTFTAPARDSIVKNSIYAIAVHSIASAIIHIMMFQDGIMISVGGCIRKIIGIMIIVAAANCPLAVSIGGIFLNFLPNTLAIP